MNQWSWRTGSANPSPLASRPGPLVAFSIVVPMYSSSGPPATGSAMVTAVWNRPARFGSTARATASSVSVPSTSRVTCHDSTSPTTIAAVIMVSRTSRISRACRQCASTGRRSNP